MEQMNHFRGLVIALFLTFGRIPFSRVSYADPIALVGTYDVNSNPGGVTLDDNDGYWIYSD